MKRITRSLGSVTAIACLILSLGTGPVTAAAHTARTVSQAGPADRRGAVELLTGPPWRRAYQARLPGSGMFTAIESAGRKDAWAVGATFKGNAAVGGFAAHWNGSHWRLIRVPVAGFVPVSVAASSSRDVWAFGYLLPLNGSVSRADALRWTGRRWQVMPLPDEPGNMWATEGGLTGAVFGPHDVWVTGGYEGSARPRRGGFDADAEH